MRYLAEKSNLLFMCCLGLAMVNFFDWEDVSFALAVFSVVGKVSFCPDAGG